MIKFDLISLLMNQFMLMFLTVIIGLWLGRILKIGSSGVVFVGLSIGWGVMKLAKSNILINESHIKITEQLIERNVIDKNFFLLFLIMFVSSVGLLTAEKVGFVIKKYGFKFILLGFIVTSCGAGLTYLMTKISDNTNPYEVSGVYTGALTSSPGLAAAIETAREHAKEWSENYDDLNDREQERISKILGKEKQESLNQQEIEQFIIKSESGVGLGYAVGYPFGVIIVILAMRLFPIIFRLNIEDEYSEFNKEMNEAKTKSVDEDALAFDIAAYCVACGAGYLLGRFKIYLGPLGYFGLGSTGGVLVSSLTLGYIGKIGKLNFNMNKKILSAIREFGLCFFLAVVGLRYGYAVIESLAGSGLYLALTALVVGMFSMLVGFLIGRYVFKINWILLSGAICGGMTSTPGLGAAIDAIGNDDPAAGYGATYPFALLGMVLFTIILHKLPM